MTKQNSNNFSAHGGDLKNLVVTDTPRKKQLQKKIENAPRIALNQRQISDLELLLNGGFSPLTGFMDEETYLSVISDMRLPNGTVWPIPIVLDVNDISQY